jgi:hypothetical protein
MHDSVAPGNQVPPEILTSFVHNHVSSIRIEKQAAILQSPGKTDGLFMRNDGIMPTAEDQNGLVYLIDPIPYVNVTNAGEKGD